MTEGFVDCQGIDIKAYGLGEGSNAERRETETHLKSCAECRDELARLQFVQAALGGLREEEPPRRIAFVSDKVFEPNWWQRFWASGPRVGFAATGLLSAAILVHAFTRPPTVVQQIPAATQVSQQQVDAAVTRAVAQVKAELEEKQNSKINQLLTATEKKYELEQQALAVAMDENTLLRKQNRQFLANTAGIVKY